MEKKDNRHRGEKEKERRWFRNGRRSFVCTEHVKSARCEVKHKRDTVKQKRKSLFLCDVRMKMLHLRNNHGLGCIELEQRVLDRI